MNQSVEGAAEQTVKKLIEINEKCIVLPGLLFLGYYSAGAAIGFFRSNNCSVEFMTTNTICQQIVNVTVLSRMSYPSFRRNNAHYQKVIIALMTPIESSNTVTCSVRLRGGNRI